MNFFERQDRARRNTRRLVVYFVLATVLIVLSVTAVVGLAAAYGERNPRHPVTIDAAWFASHAGLFLLTALATLGFIGFGSLSRTASLRSGGGAVARELGGTRITPDEQNPARKRLMNVVEEMAIASGVPVPEVYILEQETSINAFAAGFKPADAAVAVTRGAVERLNRDELQGVIGHEFSHILNGDTRLNMKLIGVLYGILLIGLAGQMLLRVGAYSGMGYSRRNRNGNPGMAMLVIGAVVAAIGFAGVFFGRLIKAAVSRQREFLADASSVQFTRNPLGLAGALKKIAGLKEGSLLHARKTEEVSHMLFGTGSRSLSGLFATHPPLAERIRALDPSFNASLLETAGGDDGSAAAIGFTGAAGAARPERFPVRPDAVTASVGNPGDTHFAYAARVLGAIPASFREAASHPATAALLTVSLVLGREPKNRARQLVLIDRVWGSERRAAVERFAVEAETLGRGYRLPLLDLTFPSLKRLSEDEVGRLLDLMQHLAAADNRIDFFEFILLRMLQTHLVDSIHPEAGASVRRPRLQRLKDEVVALLAAVAGIGAENPAAAAAAYRAGLEALGLEAGAAKDLGDIDYLRLDRALVRLDGLGGRDKERLLDALVRTVASDGTVTLEEAEMIRAVCDTLHVPVPPLAA